MQRDLVTKTFRLPWPDSFYDPVREQTEVQGTDETPSFAYPEQGSKGSVDRNHVEVIVKLIFPSVLILLGAQRLSH